MNWDKIGGCLLPLLDPVIVVFCLLAAQLAHGEPLTPVVAYLSVCAAIVTWLVFRFIRREPASTGQTALSRRLTECARVLVCWCAVIAVLLFIAFMFKISDVFSRHVMLTWFVLTPIALCVVQVVPRPSSASAAEGQKETLRPTVERPTFNDRKWGDREWAEIRWTVWGLGALIGTALLLVWLVSGIRPPPPSPPGRYETSPGKEPVHPHSAELSHSSPPK